MTEAELESLHVVPPPCTQVCIKCLTRKLFVAFYQRTSGHLTTVCRDCLKRRKRMQYAANPAHVRAHAKRKEIA